MNCGIVQVFEQVGDWWMLFIVWDVFFEWKWFFEFEESFGIVRNILSDCLKKLVQYGIFECERIFGWGWQYEYLLIWKGCDFWLMMMVMCFWLDKWIFGEDEVFVVVCECVLG